MPSGRKDAREALADLELVFKALAHPWRRHILLVLNYRDGEMTSGEIAGRFSCRWPTVSHHLSALMRAGLVQVEKRGTERVYTLNRMRLLEVGKGWFNSFEKNEE